MIFRLWLLSLFAAASAWASSQALLQSEVPLPGPNADKWARATPYEKPRVSLENWHNRLVPKTAVLRSSLAEPVTQSADQISPGAAFLNQLPESVRETLYDKGVVLLPEKLSSNEGTAAGFVRIVTIFEASVQEVLDGMTQPGQFDDYLSSLDHATAVTRLENVGELTHFRIEVLWWDIDFWVQHWFHRDALRVEWQLDSRNFQNDIKDNRGFWQLYPLSQNRVVAESGQMLDTGFPLPKGMFNRIMKRSVPKTTLEYKRIIELKPFSNASTASTD